MYHFGEVTRDSDSEILPLFGNWTTSVLQTEAEAPILWPPDVKSRFTGKDPDAQKIEGKRRRG